MSKDNPFFLSENTEFSNIRATDDLLHPQQNKLVDSDTATETQYFCFGAPEHKIQGSGYLWHHPNLDVVTGGIQAWQGVKRFAQSAELYDMRAFMNDSPLRNDLHQYRLDNGYGVEIIEPMKRHRMTYQDESRDNFVDLEFEAVSPAVMFGDGNHFEQAMKVTGNIVLRGTEVAVDSFSIRDRSWGKARPEDNMRLPPISWATAVFSEDFAINCTLFDGVNSQPALKDHFLLDEKMLLKSGWVWKQGSVRRIVSARKTVNREIGSLLPLEIMFELQDESGETFELRGTLNASCGWSPWPSFYMLLNQMRWECNGYTGYGECQDGFWTDYLTEYT